MDIFKHMTLTQYIVFTLWDEKHQMNCSILELVGVARRSNADFSKIELICLKMLGLEPNYWNLGEMWQSHPIAVMWIS